MHGTLDGYRAHRRAGEAPCDGCRRVYERYYGPDEPRADGAPVPAYNPATYKDYVSELSRSGSQQRRWGYSTPASRSQAPCGTYAGYKRHQRAGEPVCEPCRDARRLQDSNRDRKKKQKLADADV